MSTLDFLGHVPDIGLAILLTLFVGIAAGFAAGAATMHKEMKKHEDQD